MMANLSERDRRTLRFGGIGVAVILVLVLVVFPILDAWDSLQEKISKAEGAITEVERSVTEAANATLESKQLRELATVYPTRAALNQQTAALLQRVENLEGYEKLSVRRLEGLPLREEDLYFRSGVRMQFSGSLADLHRFIQAVEEAKPALKVDRLNITRSHENEAEIEGEVAIAGYAVVTEKRKRG
jgi:type II secretory pathway component PulM